MTTFTSLIIGPGAIGALACAELQSFSRVLVYPHRPSLTLSSHLELPNQSIPLTWSVSSLAEPSVDVIWVCCKAMFAEVTTQAALARYPNAIVVLLHNGMGPQQALSQRFGSRIVWGSTTCGALPGATRHFRQTSFGQTLLDARAGSLLPVYFSALFDRSDETGILRPEPSASIAAVLWQKILINACINPLTAYHGIRNGELAGTHYRNDIDAIIQEVQALMRAQNLPLPENPAQTVATVIKNSAHNWSSMARDRQRQQPTEIDFINGFLIKEGARLGIETPVLRKWYQRIAVNEES